MTVEWTKEASLSTKTEAITRNYPFKEDFLSTKTDLWIGYENNEPVAVASLSTAHNRMLVQAFAAADEPRAQAAVEALESAARLEGVQSVVVQHDACLTPLLRGAGYSAQQVKRWMRLKLPVLSEPPRLAFAVEGLDTATETELADLYTAAYQPRFPKLVMTAENFRSFFLEDADEPTVAVASGVVRDGPRLVAALVVQQRSTAELSRRYEGLAVPLEEAHGFWISELIVDPNASSRGLGRGLLEHAIWQVQQLNAREVHLNVDLDNERAERLYQALGFQRVAEPAHRSRKVLT